ncbi:mating factor alpha-1 [[Candida] railenensis]|uniref:Mating factor alpha-1 n=1 Tax=[Candida] railenensis TaxID=45579 RepID=A0A9P0QV27_9ASCO|nr:mating factor alpha-1 [[Candida] railenensis]
MKLSTTFLISAFAANFANAAPIPANETETIEIPTAAILDQFYLPSDVIPVLSSEDGYTQITFVNATIADEEVADVSKRSDGDEFEKRSVHWLLTMPHQPILKRSVHWLLTMPHQPILKREADESDEAFEKRSVHWLLTMPHQPILKRGVDESDEAFEKRSVHWLLTMPHQPILKREVDESDEAFEKRSVHWLLTMPHQPIL